MKSKRTAGIILHPTSLPGPDGIGDLGPEAYRWVDFLVKSGCSYWQVLPLGPTGYGDSPYQCFSAFAGNPYLVSPAILYDQGLLTRQDLVDRPLLPTDHVDYGPAINWKVDLLDRAFDHFLRSSSTSLSTEFEQFQHEQAGWLVDYALFMAIKEFQGGGSWSNWPNLSAAEIVKYYRISLQKTPNPSSATLSASSCSSASGLLSGNMHTQKG